MASDNNIEELCKREDRLFNRKATFDALNQEMAYNFYPERADFTVERTLGTEFAIDIYDATPILCRRDLGNARASMLRPRGQQWFKVGVPDPELNERSDIAAVLDQINTMARIRIYQAATGFVRAQKEADQDIVTFGNAVQTMESVVLDDGHRSLLNRCWHLRDCAWLDNADGTTQDFLARRFKASARHIKAKFSDATLHQDILTALEQEPDREFRLCHIMMRSDEYSYSQKAPRKTPWVSIYYDREHRMLLRERPSDRFRYVVQRWQTVSGYQYGQSPASMTSLCDARGMQVMARVLMEAGEKSLDPPLKAVQQAVKSMIDSSAGGITWVDREYDEREGPALSTLYGDIFKPPIGIELINRATLAMRDEWFLTNLKLPTHAKTAYETQQLVEEFIRANIPLFEPWEIDTERVLEEAISVLIDIGAFGPMNDWPRELSGQDLQFTFSNPLQEAIDRNLVNQATTALGLLDGALKVDQNAKHAVDVVKMLSDAVRGSGAPSDWTPDVDEAKQVAAQQGQVAGIVPALQAAGQAADVVHRSAAAAAALRDVMQPAANGQVAYGPS